MPRSDYEERKAARIERLRARAERADVEANASYAEAKRMSSVIPFGQPILVGHHSEKRDRRYRERIHNKYGKSFELSKKSERLSERADAAESNHAISSDDPKAVRLLKEKLAAEREIHEANKAANKILRKAKMASHEVSKEKLLELGIDPRVVAELVSLVRIGCMYGKYVKVPSYELSNRNQNMKRIEARIKELEAAESEEYAEFEHDGFSIVHNVDLNRVQIVFPGKPSEKVRGILKSNGFRWSRYEGAWQRHLNSSGKYAAKYVAEQIGGES